MGDHFAELPLVFEDSDPAFAEVQDVANLLLGRVAAPRDVGGAQAQDSEVGDQPFPAVVGDEADMVAAGYAELEESGREDLYVLEEGRELSALNSPAVALRILSRTAPDRIALARGTSGQWFRPSGFLLCLHINIGCKAVQLIFYRADFKTNRVLNIGSFVQLTILSPGISSKYASSSLRIVPRLGLFTSFHFI